jgi:F-type H+-transporting ATPase subunit gamma
MPSLKAIRRRIGSVRNTQQITRAMKMVAAAKLRRAQETILKGRPYALRLLHTISSLAQRVESDAHPLLKDHEGARVLLVVITSDRGLCGAFNANIIRTTEQFLQTQKDKYESISLALIGRKSYDYFKRRDYPIAHIFPEVFQNLGMEVAREIGRTLVAEFIDETFDEVHLVYNEFKSTISQRVVVEKLMPFSPLELEDEQTETIEYIYEPDRDSLLTHLLPMHVDTQVHRTLRESYAAEMGARMTAMEAATNNAKEMIAYLTLQFNRARQAAITKELMEIIGGAEAL